MWRARSMALVAAGAIAALIAGCSLAPQASYPDKPISMIVPFPPGQGVELAARAAAEAAKSALPQPLAVVNRAGGAGTLGTAEVVQAKADGYTIGFVPVAPLVVQPHVTDLPYKSPDDYTPVIRIGSNPMVLVVRAEAPWQTLGEMLEYAKSHPGQIRIGSSGARSIPHIDLELLKEQAGVDITHVPFSGSAEYLPAALGGQIEGISDSLPSFLGQIKAGKLRALATFEEQRNPLIPDVPTARELGYDITYGVYHSVIGPKGMPDSTVKALHDALKKASESESFKKWAAENSYTISYASSADLKAQLSKDYQFYGEILKKLQ